MNSTEQSPSSEAVLNYSRILRNLWNPKVHYRINKSPLPVPVQSQIKPLHHEELQYGLKRSLSESDAVCDSQKTVRFRRGNFEPNEGRISVFHR
jgi:hypothetical protein